MRGESHADTSGTRARLPANTKKQAKVASRPQSTAAKARVPEVSAWLSPLMADHGLLVSAGLSQIISNVPAAVLLSHFTGTWQPLLVGVNIGGAGTLVGSLASLITLQHFTSVRKIFPRAAALPELSTGRFLALFSVLNFGFLAILLIACGTASSF